MLFCNLLPDLFGPILKEDIFLFENSNSVASDLWELNFKIKVNYSISGVMLYFFLH